MVLLSRNQSKKRACFYNVKCSNATHTHQVPLLSGVSRPTLTYWLLIVIISGSDPKCHYLCRRKRGREGFQFAPCLKGTAEGKINRYPVELICCRLQDSQPISTEESGSSGREQCPHYSPTRVAICASSPPAQVSVLWVIGYRLRCTLTCWAERCV